MGVSLLCYGLHEIIGLGLDHYSWSSDFSLAKNQQHLNGCYCKKTNRSFFLEINYVNVKLPWTRSQDIKQHKSQFTNSNITITQCQKNFADCVMVKFEFFKLWFVLFYIYNHDFTFTLYINWTVFYINYIYSWFSARFTSRSCKRNLKSKKQCSLAPLFFSGCGPTDLLSGQNFWYLP